MFLPPTPYVEATLKNDMNQPWQVSQLERSTVSQMLLEWEITGIGLHPDGSNYVFVIRLEDSDEELFAIYKPASGERPLRDFPYGTLHNREWCAAYLSEKLGWPNIPPTVIREGPHGIGSVQLFIDADFQKHYFNLRDDRLNDFAPVAMFDVFINNADRKGGACLLDKENKLWAVDHGLTFNPLARRRTVMFEFNGTPYPDDLMTSLKHTVSQLEMKDSDVRQAMTKVLGAEEVDALCIRGNEMLETGSFPLLDPDWNVPWPMI